MNNFIFHFKSIVQSKARWLLTLIAILTLGVGQMNAYTLYFYMGRQTGWRDASAVFKLNSSDADGGTTLTRVGSTDWYTCSTTATSKMYIVRCNPSGGKWNSFSFTPSSTNNVVRLTDWNAGELFSMYVTGDGWNSIGSWDNANANGKMTISTTNTFSKTFTNVAASAHEFKIVEQGRWDYAVGWGGTITNTNCDKANSNGNIQFTPYIATGSTTITYNISTGAITVTCPKIPITLNKNSGASNGSATVDVGASSLSSITHVSRDYYDLTGYWTASSGGYKVITAAGAFVTYSSNVSDYLNNATPATWKKTSATTLYAQWTPKTYTITYKDEGGSSYSGSNSASLPASYTYGTGIASLTDGVKSGYRFDGWYTNSTCTEGPVTSISSSANGNKTFYAKWTENPGGTVTLTAGTGGQVSKNGSSWGSSTSYTGIKSTTPLNIYAQANTGYTFNTWTKTSGSGTITTNAASGVFTPVADADAALTASFTETMSTLSTSCHYDAGNPSYSAPSVSGSATTVGYATTRSITAASASTGYTFVGWTLTNCTRTDGGGATANPITIRSNGDGAAATVVANYEEVLEQDTWILKGGSAFGGTAWTTEHALTKKTGHSTESVAYHTFEIASTNTGDYNANFNFKLVKKGASDTWFGIATDSHASEWWYNRTSGEQTMSTGGGDHDNVQLRADVAGPYEVKIDYSNASSPKVTITFPTSYTLTYDIGTVKGNDGSISTSPTTASGSKVLSGNTVTLTAPDAADGYTWKGWYSNAAGTSAQLEADQEYEVTMNADKELYACYTENSYSTTVAVSPAGSGTTTPTAGTQYIKQVTGNSITATRGTDYVFDDWSVSGGGLTMSSSATTNPNTFKATSSSGTITANFSSQWTIAGSMTDPTWKWDKTSNLLTDFATISSKKHAYVTISLAANTTYTLKVKDRNQNQDNGWYGIASGSTATYKIADENTAKTVTTASGNQDISLTTAAAGDYVFDFNITDKKLAIDFPTSYLITSGVKTVYSPGHSETSDATETGGTYTAVDNSSNNVKGANKYVASGASVTFTATPEDGYEFDGWYTNAECTLGKTMTNPLTVSSITANKTYYAKFKEIMTTVSADMILGDISIDGGDYGDGQTIYVGVHTTHTVSARATDGYYFKGWTLKPLYDDDPINFAISGDKDDEDNSTVTVRGLGAAGSRLQMLDGQYGNLERIYFRNRFDDGSTVTHWDNVYVYFDVSEEDSRVKTSAKNVDSTLHVQMTTLGYYDIYEAKVPRHITRYGKYNVAFANFDYAYNSYKLWPGSGSSNHGQAVYRTDYKPKNNLFVPYHVATATNTTDVSGNTDYFNDGYWITYANSLDYGKAAGYYIERRTGTNTYSGRATDCEFKVLEGAWSDHPKIQFSLRIDGLEKDKYVIFNEAGHKYRLVGADKETTKITHSNCTEIEVIEDNDNDEYFVLTPTAEGEYIITLDQGGDRMKISVEYPIVAGDYVIENVFNDGTAKTTRSNVIKASKGSEKTRYSMYLNNAGSGTLKLRKCTEINASGVPVWSTGDNTNLQDILDDAKFTKGVYQFDITVNTSTDKVSEVDSLRLYTGNFYLKTDAAPGGWVAYKNNAMEKNSVNFDRTSLTYDNYWCHYFASKDCNIKSVIANDYCNQLSDTVKGDDIARMYEGEPYVPVDGTSIRFSYNSATNETKRAYLGASLANDFLNIYPSTDNKIFRTVDAVEYDLYDIRTSDKGKCKFADNGNWVYEMDVKVKPSGKAGVTATYTDASSVAHVQTLIPDTNTVLGGSSSSDNEYSIRIVYDFKTNFMMSSFVLDGSTINEDLKDFDMLWVRHKDNSATQLTLGTGKKLTNVRPIGAIEFRYDSVYYSASSGAHWVDLYSWNNPGARQYLKYFVSFPFDVEVNSIFGLNQAKYGRYWHYVIQKYDGATRAKEGLFFGDGDNYWVDLEPGDTLKANEGYCVIFDNDYVRGIWGNMWDNKETGSRVYLYFPATKEISSITNSDEVMTVAPLTCTIDRTYTVGGKEKNHKNTDSHWHMIGNPLFHDAYIKDFTNGGDSTLKSYYYMDLTSPLALQDWKPMTITKGVTKFNAMSSVLVQWFGTINWSLNPGPYAAPKRRTDEDKNYLAQLDIWYNGVNADQAFVRLADGANDGFELREDMSKVLVKSRPNIYTFTGDYDVAYNEMPIANCTIPVGVVIRKNGTYTFSMPSNFSGTVTLIDTYAQTRTNLAIEDYEIYLDKGTIDDRFLLEIRIDNAPTAIDGVTDGSGTLKDGKVHKFIMNDQMYILRDGVLYDARGNRVK